MNQLLSGKIPQTNQQQQSQSPEGQTSNAQSGGINMTDKDMCTDILITEKYVSGTYDTAIFEFKDTRVCDVLTEAVFQYMESKGMYNVQISK